MVRHQTVPTSEQLTDEFACHEQGLTAQMQPIGQHTSPRTTANETVLTTFSNQYM